MNTIKSDSEIVLSIKTELDGIEIETKNIELDLKDLNLNNGFKNIFLGKKINESIKYDYNSSEIFPNEDESERIDIKRSIIKNQAISIGDHVEFGRNKYGPITGKIVEIDNEIIKVIPDIQKNDGALSITITVLNIKK